MTKCKNCNCECHCENTLHVPSDELDSGGLCTCIKCNCKRTYEFEKDHGSDISFENEVKHQ